MIDKATEERIAAGVVLQRQLQQGFATVSLNYRLGNVDRAAAAQMTTAVIRDVLDTQARAYHAILPDAPLPEEYPN